MSKHCIVIGAGIVGASCAWHLRKSGLQVTLIDSGLPGQSCSSGNAACIASSGIVPLSYPGLIRKVPGWLFDPLGPMSIRWKAMPSLLPWFWHFWRVSNMPMVEKIATAQAALMTSAFDDYDEILKAAGALDLKKSRGAIHIYDSEKEYRAAAWQYTLARRFGFNAERLDLTELKSLVPSLKLDSGVAVMEPDWHHLIDPEKVTARIADACFADGANWIQDRVTEIIADDHGVCVKTVSGKSIKADQLVVAAGAWSNTLAGQIDYRVPLIGKRGYHSQVSEPGLTLEYPVMSVSRAFVMTPMADGLRVAGTSEFASLDAPADFRRARVLLKQARHYLPGLNTQAATEWMGHRPMMADSTPVISVSPNYANVFYAFGHGHYGITQGPTTGRLIADMVAGKTPSIDMKPYVMGRFGNT